MISKGDKEFLIGLVCGTMIVGTFLHFLYLRPYWQIAESREICAYAQGAKYDIPACKEGK